MRDYFQYIEELKQTGKNRKYFSIKEIGRAGKYPMYSILLKGKGKIKVLLSTGTHGDEPAGPEALARFLKKDVSKLLKSFEFLIFPCINPYGYEKGTRTNGKRMDINRSFDDKETEESKLIKKTIKGMRFALFVDFHEDWEYKGFYLYELSKNKYFGKSVIAGVKKVIPINMKRIIDGRPAKKGLIVPVLEQPDIGEKPFPRFAFKHHTNHIITLETPSTLKLEKRVNAHLAALQIALKLLKNFV